MGLRITGIRRHQRHTQYWRGATTMRTKTQHKDT